MESPDSDHVLTAGKRNLCIIAKGQRAISGLAGGDASLLCLKGDQFG